MPAAKDRAAKLTACMKTNLQLSAQPEPKVHDINLKYAHQLEQALPAAKTKMQKSKAAKAIDAAKDDELKQVLTAKQFKTYETKKEELKKQMKAKAKEKKSTG